MYKIYIVEDDFGIASSIKKLAEQWGMEAIICENFRKVPEEVAAYSPHLVLMDIMLPFAGGFYWCGEIRKFSNVPIIFLSSAADNMNMVMAMNMGADDFIAKPFDGNVLMAKINALLRRSYDFAESSPVLMHDGVILNLGDNIVSYEEQKLELTRNEFRILQSLMESKGKIVSREKLMERLWESDSFVDENTLSVNVNRLRKKLESIGLKEYIKTKFGSGYILE